MSRELGSEGSPSLSPSSSSSSSPLLSCTSCSSSLSARACSCHAESAPSPLSQAATGSFTVSPLLAPLAGSSSSSDQFLGLTTSLADSFVFFDPGQADPSPTSPKTIGNQLQPHDTEEDQGYSGQSTSSFISFSSTSALFQPSDLNSPIGEASAYSVSLFPPPSVTSPHSPPTSSTLSASQPASAPAQMPLSTGMFPISASAPSTVARRHPADPSTKQAHRGRSRPDTERRSQIGSPRGSNGPRRHDPPARPLTPTLPSSSSTASASSSSSSSSSSSPFGFLNRLFASTSDQPGRKSPGRRRAETVLDTRNQSTSEQHLHRRSSTMHADHQPRRNSSSSGYKGGELRLASGGLLGDLDEVYGSGTRSSDREKEGTPFSLNRMLGFLGIGDDGDDRPSAELLSTLDEAKINDIDVFKGFADSDDGSAEQVSDRLIRDQREREEKRQQQRRQQEAVAAPGTAIERQEGRPTRGTNQSSLQRVAKGSTDRRKQAVAPRTPSTRDLHTKFMLPVEAADKQIWVKPETVCDGTLQKLNKNRTRWSLRWFGIFPQYPHTLFWFTEEPRGPENCPVGRIDLEAAYVRECRMASVVDTLSPGLLFEITTADHIHYLSCSSEDDMATWCSWLAPRTSLSGENLSFDEFEHKISYYERVKTDELMNYCINRDAKIRARPLPSPSRSQVASPLSPSPSLPSPAHGSPPALALSPPENNC